MGTELLLLEASWRARLESWSRVAAPREACGLLLGRDLAAGTGVVRALWSNNLAMSNDRFELDPAAHLLAELVAREDGLDVVGVWHSHPRGGAAPSVRDRSGAHPGWWYVIVGLGSGGAELKAWRALAGDLCEGTLA